MGDIAHVFHLRSRWMVSSFARPLSVGPILNSHVKGLWPSWDQMSKFILMMTQTWLWGSLPFGKGKPFAEKARACNLKDGAPAQRICGPCLWSLIRESADKR